jgi:Glycosyl hydrolase catalytic core
VQAWLTAVAAVGMTPHVAFEHLASDRCPSRPCTTPTAAEYGAAVWRFVARFPQVRTYTTWNEANHVSQPVADDPEAVAAYYDELRAACRTCTIVAGDVLDSGSYRRWLQRFLRASTTTPRLWGLHDYGDVTYGRTTGVDAVLATVPGTLWIEETGGLVSLRNAPAARHGAGARSRRPGRSALEGRLVEAPRRPPAAARDVPRHRGRVPRPRQRRDRRPPRGRPRLPHDQGPQQRRPARRRRAGAAPHPPRGAARAAGRARVRDPDADARALTTPSSERRYRMKARRPLATMAIASALALTGAGAAWACDGSGSSAGTYPGESSSAGTYPGETTTSSTSSTTTTSNTVRHTRRHHRHARRQS